MPGRRGSETRRKSEQIMIRLEPDRYQAVVDAAAAAGMTVTDLARHRLLGLRVVTRTDMKAIGELRRQGGIAMMALRTRGMRDEGRAALSAIRALINRVAGGDA
jgi:hypothetical protein